MHRLSYKLLLLFTVLATVGGLLTLMPRAAASYPNIIGYSSLCTFAPAATLFCFLAAGISCFIRSTFIKDQSGSAGARFRKHSPRLFVLVLILAGALIFTGVYAGIKKQYPDEITGASEAGINP